MDFKSRIYPAICWCMALLALLIAVNFIEQHRPPASLLTDVDIGNFEKTVLQSKTPVFVEFYKRGCQPCNQDIPLLNKLVGEYQGRVTFVRVDMDRSAALADGLHVTTAPTHVIFNPATGVAFAKTGYLDETALRALIEKSLQPPAPPASPVPVAPAPATPSPATPTATPPAAGTPPTSGAPPAAPNASQPTSAATLTARMVIIFLN